MITLHVDEQLGWRGGEQQASYLVRGLAERGHTVLIAGRSKGAFIAKDHGVADLVRIPLPFRGEWDLYSAWRLARAVRRHNVDIIHAHTSHAHAHACLARKIAGRGVVVVTRRVDFVPASNVFTRWKYARADGIAAISECIAQVLRNYGVSASKITVIPSVQDAGRFEVAPAIRSSLGVPEDAPLLVCVAALVGHKDHATLLSAMRNVLREIPKLQLLLVGEGELRPAIESQIARLGMGENVHLLGCRQDVPAILRAADAFVLSSKMEGMGSACLEAMICGIPVVACAAGGIPEVVRHEKTGLLAPPGNPEALAAAIVRVFREPDLACAMVGGGRKLIQEQYTVDRMVESYIRLYERLLDGEKMS